MTDKPKSPEQSPGERTYAIVCLLALLLIVLLLLYSGMGVWSILPMLVGGVTFLLRWRSGPPLVLVTCLLMAPTRYPASGAVEPFFTALTSFVMSQVFWLEGAGYMVRRQRDSSLRFEDVLLAVALLTYTASCYRSLALSLNLFPLDGVRTLPVRRSPSSPSQPVPGNNRRPGQAITSLETPTLCATIAGCVALALLAWYAVAALPPQLELSRVVWRNLIYFWLFVAVLLVCVTLFRYLGRRRASTDENLLYLQDQLWLQTRQEQSTLNRWLVWARLRGQRRKEY